MRNSLLLLICFLSFGKFSTAQNAISVYSRGSMINKIAEANNKLYIATYGKGVVVYDMENGAYQTMDISNSPMTSNVIYTVQAFTGDTQIVSNGYDSWLVANRYWTNIVNNVSSEIVMADDGTIFDVGNGGMGAISKFNNGVMDSVTDTILNGYEFAYVQANYHNQLYFTGQLVSGANYYTYFKYSSGVWTKLPVFSDSGRIARPGDLFFDQNDDAYLLESNGNYSNNWVYKLDSAGWNRVLLPDTGSMQLTGVGTDSNGTRYFFYYTSNIVNETFTGSYVWNSVTNHVTQLPVNIIPLGMPGQVFSYQGNLFFASDEDGLIKWNIGANTFTSVDYANTCIQDYLLGTFGGSSFLSAVYIGNRAVACRQDSIYVIADDGALYMTDTSISNCVMLDTSTQKGAENEALCTDNHGNVWALLNNGTTITNLTTGTSQSYTGPGAYAVFVYDSLIWVADSVGMNQVIDGNKQFITSNFEYNYMRMDKTGNLWAENVPSNEVSIMHLDKNGTTELVRSWDFGDPNGYYYPEVSMDATGNPWILIYDTLARYSTDSLAINFSVVKPHTSNGDYAYFQVYDSTEMVLVSNDAIEYFRNGIWKYYDLKFSTAYISYVLSFHDHRLIFFTQEDGIIEYNLDGNFDTNGDHAGGIVFNDLNGNHIQDSTDIGLVNVPVAVNGSICSSNSFGQYGLDVPNGNYTIKLQTPPYYTCYPDSYNVTLNNNVMDTLNFACYAPQPVNDLSLNLTACPFLINYGGALFISVRNSGTSAANPIVTVTYDTSLVLSYSEAPILTQSHDSVSIQMNTIYPLEETNALLEFTGHANTDSAAWIHFQATAYPVIGDTTPLNNTDTVSVFTVGSYDPNYKAVQPQGTGIYNSVDTNQTLTYTIGFQNTGTAEAINITIVDTLDNGLDLSTFKYISCSRPNTYQLWGRVLTITLKNIDLPDSATSEAASMGYFKFSINPAHPVQINQPVVNTAYIYFDFNPAVATNAATVSFGPPVYTSISDPFDNTPGNVVIWPQPCADELNIYLSKQIQMPAVIKLFDLTGKLVLTKQVENNTEKVSVSNLSSGIYILCVQDRNDKSYRFKCIKTK